MAVQNIKLEEGIAKLYSLADHIRRTMDGQKCKKRIDPETDDELYVFFNQDSGVTIAFTIMPNLLIDEFMDRKAGKYGK